MQQYFEYGKKVRPDGFLLGWQQMQHGGEIGEKMNPVDSLFRCQTVAVAFVARSEALAVGNKK